MDNTVAFSTLGCKVNQYETDALRELFEKSGFSAVDFTESADIYVINTCTVTAEADRKSRQLISRAHKQNPLAKIIVVGCYAQRAADDIMKLPGVFLAVGTKDRLDIPKLLKSDKSQSTVTPYTRHEPFESINAVREGRTRATLKIQDGCDRFCTYCIIPYVRGEVRSRPLADVRSQLLSLANEGFLEVVLTGIHLMSYGSDLAGGVSLADAIASANDIPDLKRIRLGSLEPQLLEDGFISYLSDNPKICRHFHLSLQSGSSTVLARMGRRYDAEQYLLCVKRLRDAMPDCAITTDIIAGFPGETEYEFNQTLEFLQKAELARIHVFPYSRREGTRAAAMSDQLPRSVKAARASALIELGRELERNFCSRYLGKTVSVLFEDCKDGLISGHTGTYVQVAVEADSRLEGKIADVSIDKVFSSPLKGVIINKE